MSDVSNLTPNFDEEELRRCAAFFRQYAKTLTHWLPKSPSFAERNIERADTLLRAIEAYDALRERCLQAEVQLIAVRAEAAQLRADAKETRPVQWTHGNDSHHY